MIIKEQKQIEFINDCEAIFDNEELYKAILWYQDKPTSRIKHVYIHGNYPAISIYEKKIHIHRLLMMYWLDSKIPKEYYVHHIDGNKLNALKSNLSVVYEPVHQSQHNKGKIMSEKTRQLISESNHKRIGIKYGITKREISYQKIWELYKQGYSINKISKTLDYDWKQVKVRLQEIFENPELIGDDENG